MNTLLHLLARPALFFSLLLTTGSTFAQSSTVFDALSKVEGQALTLSLDMHELGLQKKTNNYQTATLAGDGFVQTTIEVRARGKFRRRTCEIPPLKLKFSKKKLAALGLVDSLNEVKLVVPCVDDREGEDYILREYTAYRLYEQLSDYYVRARLVKVVLHDTHTGTTHPAVWAMLVEHEEQVAARLQGKFVETYGLQASDVQPEATAMHAAFQYLIGNTDWHLLSHRNVYLLQRREGEKLIPIPYDFDFAGLVNASYAIPNSNYGLTTVQARHWMNEEVSPDQLQLAIRLIQQQRAALETVCRHPLLGERNTRSMLRYLSGFFEQMEARTKSGR